MSPVSIAAYGLVSAFGAGIEPFWHGLLDGQSRVSSCPSLGGQAIAAAVPASALSRAVELQTHLPSIADHPLMDKSYLMLLEAVEQVRQHPVWSSIDAHSLGVAVGTTQGPIQTWSAHQERIYADSQDTNPSRNDSPFEHSNIAPTRAKDVQLGGATVADALALPPLPTLAGPTFWLAQHLGAKGPVACPSVACATGTFAIGLGAEWIRSGQCEAVIAGGVDALSTLVYQGFRKLKALDGRAPRPFDSRRKGLAVGEGAALVLLTKQSPIKRQVSVYGWGSSADANHLTGPDPTGSGLARALRSAIHDAGVETGAVDFISAHGTGTVFNDLMESKAFAQVFGSETHRLLVNSIKGAIGHTMAAAGTFEAILCERVLNEGVAPPTANLEELDPSIDLDVVQGSQRKGRFEWAASTSSGFGGINAALILGR